MKTMVRPLFPLFFNGRPALLLPLANRGFVPFQRASGWPLHAPIHRAQKFPDMPRVIADAEFFLD
jgi:hypothetical protein